MYLSGWVSNSIDTDQMQYSVVFAQACLSKYMVNMAH